MPIKYRFIQKSCTKSGTVYPFLVQLFLSFINLRAPVFPFIMEISEHIIVLDHGEK